MAILIKDTITNPRSINNGTTDIVITFKGQTIGLTDADVVVDFKISPFPELSFEGLEKISSPYTFTATEAEFSKNVSIQNNTTPIDNVNYRNGLIALVATDHKAGSIMSDNVAIKFV